MMIKGQEEKEIIELMRKIKNNKPNEYLKLIGAMKLLGYKKIDNTDKTSEQALLKLLDIQNKIINKQEKDLFELIANIKENGKIVYKGKKEIM